MDDTGVCNGYVAIPSRTAADLPLEEEQIDTREPDWSSGDTTLAYAARDAGIARNGHRRVEVPPLYHPAIQPPSRRKIECGKVGCGINAPPPLFEDEEGEKNEVDEDDEDDDETSEVDALAGNADGDDTAVDDTGRDEALKAYNADMRADAVAEVQSAASARPGEVAAA